MTNFEKYKDEILKIIKTSKSGIAGVKDGIPFPCNIINCSECSLNGDGSNCIHNFIKRLYEDDDEGRDCEGCKHYDKSDTAEPCKYCKRCYIDKFEYKLKKTRQDEFLEHYPNAKVSEIQPCAIEEENFGKYCGKYDQCSDCVDDYWSQEVE